MIFGDGVGASLVRGPYCQLDVGLWEVDVFLHWNSAAGEGAWVGLKPDLQGGTGFNLLRVQFWTPVQKKRVSKRVRKWTRLKSKVVFRGGSSFGPFLTLHCGKFVEAFISSCYFGLDTWLHTLTSTPCGILS